MKASLVTLFSAFVGVKAFQGSLQAITPRQDVGQSRSAIYSAFNRKNKQGELLKKMELAKKQARERELSEMGDNLKTISDKYRLSDEEIRIQNDRKRFDELLNSESATTYDMEGGFNYKTKEQEEEEMNAGCKSNSFFSATYKYATDHCISHC